MLRPEHALALRWGGPRGAHADARVVRRHAGARAAVLGGGDPAGGGGGVWAAAATAFAAGLPGGGALVKRVEIFDVLFRADAWECWWELLDPVHDSKGWLADTLLHPYCARRVARFAVFERANREAVVLSTRVAARRRASQ